MSSFNPDSYGFITFSILHFFCNFLSNLFDTFEEYKWTKENMYRDIIYTLVSHLIKSCVICKSESLGWELHCVLTTERLLPVSLKAICFRLNTFMDELKYNTTASFPTRKVFLFFCCTYCNSVQVKLIYQETPSFIFHQNMFTIFFSPHFACYHILQFCFSFSYHL